MEYYEELGLSRNESRVYETLVEHGIMGSGEISGKSGVSYSRIYNVLDGLIEKGLVKVVPEKTKKFIPSSPESLIKLIDYREKRLEKAREKAKELKKFYEVKEKNPVTMVFGRKGFHRVIRELKDVDKYSYSIKWTSSYEPEWVGYAERSIKKGKDHKTLTRYDKETEKDVKKWLKINKNIRKFENEGIAIDIRDNKEVLIGLIKSNVTLLIKDRAFCKLMRQLFLDSYEKAEKIT
ncbi:hypothetical protein GF386_05475 [Candidatus Pacearchaeota archaeon]|nr:hypothetical protein [Candidatus Pacearchaeota archaeon]MBD3283550.1 hypothetical protein [Candidatus Pacearchaeota archaeon]